MILSKSMSVLLIHAFHKCSTHFIDNSTVTSTKGYVTTDGMQTTDMTSYQDSSTWITSNGSESTSIEIHISESNKSTRKFWN